MEIKKIIKTWGHYDFSAIMVCEHCAHEGELNTGYDDAFFHNKVIPVMLCSSCGKNKAGGKETNNTEVGVMTI